MGADVQIGFKLKDGYSLNHFVAERHDILGHFDEVPRVSDKGLYYYGFMDRYYGKEYARGSWPRICVQLLDYLANPAVEEVYYGSDYDDDIFVLKNKVTLEMINDLNQFYIKHRNKPYDDMLYRKSMETS